jgi:hypothetical protein
MNPDEGSGPTRAAGGTPRSPEELWPEQVMQASVTRISDLATVPYRLQPLERTLWASGDYVAARVVALPSFQSLELPTGRLMELTEGDLVVGALGRRYATLELTGTWEAVGSDGRMALLTGGGLLGACTSRSVMIPAPAQLEYHGHLVRDGGKVSMGQFAGDGGPSPGTTGSAVGLHVPTVMIIGTSMSAGKTSTARTVIRRLRRRGQRILAGKVTGAARYRDVLTMGDSGASPIFDFVDAGLPSTVCPAEEYQAALDLLLSRMRQAPVDAAVIEVGASPLEPYNGTVAVERLMPSVRVTILCASDPYAVVGLMKAYGLVPDLVTGITSNTRAGIELVEELAGVPCVNVRGAEGQARLDRLLEDRLIGS